MPVSLPSAGRPAATLAAVAAAALLAGCAAAPRDVREPRGSAAPGFAHAMSCESVVQRFSAPGLRIASAERVAAGALVLPGIAWQVPEHCVVKGSVDERTSPVDGKRYAIGFEMRLPASWNGRFMYQANGGLDGFVTPAYGDILGGGPTSNGLTKGFAVMSSDAGHAFDRSTPIGGATFGLDAQARRDYGYNAVARLTPLAKSMLASYYGKRPDTSYIVGTSNGGRHAFVAAARLPGEYDGILAVTPGYELPRAAVAQVWGAQQFAKVARRGANGRPDLATAFPPADLRLVAERVLARCDMLDGAFDGIVADVAACQEAFDAQRDIPTCGPGAAGSGQCLTQAQKDVLVRVFAGPSDATGMRLYDGLPWDAGVAGADWARWKFDYSVGPRDAIALAFVMTTPPASPGTVTGQGTTLIDYALGFDVDRDAGRIFTTEGPYTESAMEFMTPRDPAFREFVRRGGKLIVLHGTADPVFSALGSVRWMQEFTVAHGAAQARRSARLFLVPGMNHSRGGPATDQFDALDPLVRWVESGEAPARIEARARGAGSPVPNAEVPSAWNPARTRPLCPWPEVTRYSGQGDIENAASFACVAPAHQRGTSSPRWNPTY
ncbi:MAG: tannase/feruloyl esterase family alpha/beta hydrolase [Burkholderiaceae bacterium]|nr:tannase/feruloyl esterase family alpha/beta hydrolase [Burkholderiaceae bacterium]